MGGVCCYVIELKGRLLQDVVDLSKMDLRTERLSNISARNVFHRMASTTAVSIYYTSSVQFRHLEAADNLQQCLFETPYRYSFLLDAIPLSCWACSLSCRWISFSEIVWFLHADMDDGPVICYRTNHY